MTRKRQLCRESHERSDPQPLCIACRCEGCEGELRADDISAVGNQAILICATCRCAYAIPATKEMHR